MLTEGFRAAFSFTLKGEQLTFLEDLQKYIFVYLYHFCDIARSFPHRAAWRGSQARSP